MVLKLIGVQQCVNKFVVHVNKFVVKNKFVVHGQYLATKGFNTTLVQSIPPCHVIIRNIMHLIIYHVKLLCHIMSLLWRAQFPMCTKVHLTQFCMHKILCRKNI